VVWASTLGLVVGLYLLSQAWSTLLAPPEGMEAESLAEETNTHPDAALGLTPHAELGRRRAEAIAAETPWWKRPIW